MGELHAEHRVTGGRQRVQDGGVGLGARVRLDVGVVGAEESLGAGDGQVLGDVDVLAAAVVPLAGVALGVLVREHGALGLQDGARDEVLRRDHLEGLALAAELGVQDGGDLGVQLGQRRVHGGVDGHVSPSGSGVRAWARTPPVRVTRGPGVRPVVACCVAPRW